MNSERYQQIKSILMEALETPAFERDAFVAAACGDDRELRGEVDSLLKQAVQDDDFLEPIAAPEHDPLIGTTVAGYRVLKVLGEGGMGVVYLGEDERLGRRAALKFLRPELIFDDGAKARLIREARAGAALDHPNICPLYGVDEMADGQLFLAMRFYEGETLKERLTRGAIPLGTSLDIATQIANGLEAAHQTGIVHRDVKPGNLLITDGIVKILDFGIAKVRDHVPLTIGGGTLGTADYMSPEQAAGTTVDHRTDVWALGVVLFEMTTGTSASHARRFVQSAEKANRDRIPRTRVPGAPLPDDVVAIIMRAMARAVLERYQSMAEFAAALEAVRRRTHRPPERAGEARPQERLRAVVRRDGEIVWSGDFDTDKLVIGRGPQSDVVLNDAEVSWTHASVRRDRAGDLIFADQSSNGSFLNGRRVESTGLGRGGVISIPPFDVELRTIASDDDRLVTPVVAPVATPRTRPNTENVDEQPAPRTEGVVQLRFIKGPAAILGRVFDLGRGTHAIGRAEDCAVRLDVPSISRYHATISRADDDAWTIEDTGSTNGIEANGVAVQRARIRPGDRVGFGTDIVAALETLTVEPPAGRSTGSPFAMSIGPSRLDTRVTVIRIVGRVDGRQTSARLQEQLTSAIGAARLFLVLDLSACGSCDESGFAVFVGIDVMVRRRGGALYLAGLSASVNDTYVALRLERSLLARADEAAAVSALASTLNRR